MGPHNPYIQQFSGLDKFSPQFPDRLSDLLDDRDSISNLSNQHATWLADYLDEVRIQSTCGYRFLKSA